MDLSIRRTIPHKVLPAPNSQTSDTPSETKYMMLSRHRTTPVTCLTNKERISDGSVTAAAFTLAIIGNVGLENISSF